MSNWESIFGPGVSAESFLARINASHAEFEEEEEREDHGLQKRLGAFGGSNELKSELIAKLQESSPADVRLIGKGGLDSQTVEQRYQIPLSLAYLIDVISDGLPRKRRWPGDKDTTAATWLLHCLDAIQPGVDIRLVGWKLLASVAKESLHSLSLTRRWSRHAHDSSTLVRICVPAVHIIYARARGVLAENHLVALARQVTWDAVSPRWTEGASTGDDNPEDFPLAAISCALEGSPLEAARAVTWAAYGRFEQGECGDAGTNFYLEDYGSDLISLLHACDNKRIKILDMNMVSHLLDEP